MNSPFKKALFSRAHVTDPNQFGSNAFPAPAVLNAASRCWIDITDTKTSESWSVEMDSTPFVIGRAPESNLRLDHDTVSRQHAEVYRDPFKRIWIRDLGSRNGVKINDQKVSEHLVEPRQMIRIGQFAMKIRLEDDPSNTEELPLAEVLPVDSVLEISTFKTLDGSRVAVEQLSAILALGGRLAQTAEPAPRMRSTCEMLIDPQLAGEAVWLLRIERQRPERPQMLFGPVVSEKGTQTTLHVSTTLLREVLKTGTAQLGTNEPSGHLLMLSLAADVRTIAAAACPIAMTSKFVDVLYVIYPAKHASPEWLALTSLVANQFTG